MLYHGNTAEFYESKIYQSFILDRVHKSRVSEFAILPRRARTKLDWEFATLYSVPETPVQWSSSKPDHETRTPNIRSV